MGHDEEETTFTVGGGLDTNCGKAGGFATTTFSLKSFSVLQHLGRKQQSLFTQQPNIILARPLCQCHILPHLSVKVHILLQVDSNCNVWLDL